MQEKLCIQWNEFKDNFVEAFGRHRADNDFTDVTLVCEDGQQVEAHKIILAASSSFFSSLLRRNQHAHPMILMRRVSLDQLLAIMDFLYFGEVNIYQEDLDSFLAIGAELQLMGLDGNTEKIDDNSKFPTTSPKTSSPVQKIKAELNHEKPPPISESSFDEECDEKIKAPMVSRDLQDLIEKTNSMTGRTSRRTANGKALCVCKVCGKEGESGNIKQHIEQNHIEGVSIPCNQCKSTFR